MAERNSLYLENEQLKKELQSLSLKIYNATDDPELPQPVDVDLEVETDAREAVFLECVEANERLQQDNLKLVIIFYIFPENLRLNR